MSGSETLFDIYIPKTQEQLTIPGNVIRTMQTLKNPQLLEWRIMVQANHTAEPYQEYARNWSETKGFYFKPGVTHTAEGTWIVEDLDWTVRINDSSFSQCGPQNGEEYWVRFEYDDSLSFINIDKDIRWWRFIGDDTSEDFLGLWYGYVYDEVDPLFGELYIADIKNDGTITIEGILPYCIPLP